MTSLECAQTATWELSDTLYTTGISSEIGGDPLPFAVSMSADGIVVAVGLPAPNGTVTVYTLASGSWVVIGSAISIAFNDYFGASVALAANNPNIMIVGVPANGAYSPPASGGAVYYIFDGTEWVQTGPYLLGDNNNGDEVGASVAISADGTVVAVGAPGGSYVIIYDCSATGCVYHSTITVVSGSRFGQSVSLSADGIVVAAGAPHFNNASDALLTKVGAVFVKNISMVRSTGEAWILGTSTNQSLGSSVSIAGSIVASMDGTGATILVSYTAGQDTLVPIVTTIPVSSPHSSVALSGDGSVVVVGNVSSSMTSVYRIPGFGYEGQFGIRTVGSLLRGAAIAVSYNGTAFASGSDRSLFFTNEGVEIYTQDTENTGWAVKYADDDFTVVARRYCCAESSGCGEEFRYSAGINDCACPSTPSESRISNNPEPCEFCVVGGEITMMYCGGFNDSTCTSTYTCPNDRVLMNDACVPTYQIPAPVPPPTQRPTGGPTFRIDVDPGGNCWTFVVGNADAVCSNNDDPDHQW
jgi:hypothetical protein